MATRLVGLDLAEVSFVDSGANLDKETGDGAHVVLWKRRGDEEMEVNETFWEKLTATIKGVFADENLKIAPPVVKQEDKTEVHVTEEEVTKRIGEVETAKSEVEKRLAEAEAEKAEIAKRLEAIEAEKAEAVKKAAEEEDKRIAAEFVKKAEDQYPHLPGNPADKGAILRKLSDTLEPEDFAKLDAMLKAAEELAKGGFEPKGKDGSGKDAGQQLSDIAKGILDAGEAKTREGAYAEACRRHPDLVVESRGR